MNAVCKLFMALTCAVSIAVPSFASGTVDGTVPGGDVSENSVVTICDAYSQQLGILDAKGGGTYSGIISGLNLHGKFSVRVKVDDTVYGSEYMGKWQGYSDETWKEAISNIVYSATMSDGVEFEANEFPYEDARFTVTIAADSSTLTLGIADGSSADSMTFGEGVALTFDKAASLWQGNVSLEAGCALPALTYFNDASGETSQYWFPADFDGTDASERTVTLATEPSSARCLTGGIYRLSVSIAPDGTATATYACTNPPVVIGDGLYVCVYDKHYAPDQWGNYSFGYHSGDSFTNDYKVSYRLADGSYAIAIGMDYSQAFYIMNNGVAYRPALADVDTPFASQEGDMATFTFTPSADHSLRKKVSYGDNGYRMLIISANGSNIDVKGYRVDVDEANRMNIIGSLAAPADDFGHMADVILHFKGDAAQGYIDGYRKLDLQPSGAHGIHDLCLKAGQEFEICRGRAIYGESGEIIGIDEKDMVRYGCKNSPAQGATTVTLTDGDISTLYDQYSGQCLTTTYSVVRDGEFSFVIFYTTTTKQITVSRKVLKDRGIKIGAFDASGMLLGDYADMQYKNNNRRNLMSACIPRGGYVEFGYPVADASGREIVEPFQFYNLGLSNSVGYDTEATGEKVSRFEARDEDFADGADTCWYRFRMRLREDGNYYMSYQVVNMPDKVWLYVDMPDGVAEYEAAPDSDNPGHYVFAGVNMPAGAEYYFVNRRGADINPGWTLADGDPADGLVWYAAHTSSDNNGQDANPALAGRRINMFNHLNVGTDYQNEKYRFKKFHYNGTRPLENVEVDMDIASMSHRYGVDYEGRSYYFEGSCAGVQLDGKLDWAKQNEKYRFVYHPTTGYYTCYLEYLWGDWFIYNYDEAGLQQTSFYPFNLNNVIHEINHPYYLSDGQNRYISDAKKELTAGTAADTPIPTVDNTSYKDRFMIAMAPDATAIIQGSNFQYDWVQSPVYKDVTIVFDPANNVLWLVSGHTDSDDDGDNPYGELYIVFTDVEPSEWDRSRLDEYDGAESGAHWVKLKADPDELGRYTADGVKFPVRAGARHSSYFFSNRLGHTLAETIRHSNNYHAGSVDPTYEPTADETLYGSVFTKLVYNEDGRDGRGSFESHDKPLSIVNTAATAYAPVVYVRRWDNKELAPFENCYVDARANSARRIGRAAIEEEGGEAPAPESSSVATTDDLPQTAEGDYVLRTFASEPYVYDVTVHLGRQIFDLVTTPRLVVSGNDDMSADAAPSAVIRAGAGHITVTGAASVSIYTAAGVCILRDASGADIDVAPGVYIVVADGRASKHIL